MRWPPVAALWRIIAMHFCCHPSGKYARVFKSGFAAGEGRCWWHSLVVVPRDPPSLRSTECSRPFSFLPDVVMAFSFAVSAFADCSEVTVPCGSGTHAQRSDDFGDTGGCEKIRALDHVFVTWHQKAREASRWDTL